MFGKNQPRQRAGRKISARNLVKLQVDAERAGRLQAGPGQGIAELNGSPLLQLQLPSQLRVAKSAGGGIAAMTGSTPGSGTITLYDFDGTGLVVMSDDTAYNFSLNGVAGSKWLIVGKLQGYWFIVAESCV